MTWNPQKSDNIELETKINHLGREKKKFKPTQLGIEINNIMLRNFQDLMNYQYTSNMETQLDEIAIGYGKFIEASVDFLIISIAVFAVVKFMNQLKGKAQDATDSTVTTPKDIELLTKLNELMEEQNALMKEKLGK